ncbi:hypothetical protein C1X30_02240 [Pseudomonas sp. FW305-BF6]|nr:hypothetical protein C1X28_06530 [Pseudomonas sp. FW305-BF15]PNB82540.1 hypothetical protein C1X30_02240 [Pseudomonas sp. FW305-BF6]
MEMPQGTLRVPALEWDAERPGLHSHAERGNDLRQTFSQSAPTSGTPARRALSRCALPSFFIVRV